jgi:hypothetical protein
LKVQQIMWFSSLDIKICFSILCYGHETTKDEDNRILINVSILLSKKCVD